MRLSGTRGLKLGERQLSLSAEREGDVQAAGEKARPGSRARKGRGEGSVRVGLGRRLKHLSGDGTSEGGTMHTKRVRGQW